VLILPEFNSLLTAVCELGQCKGYGFVEYSHNREKSELARRQLEGLSVSGSVLRCQFVPASLVHFSDLQSRCLLVTNIPHDVSTTAMLHRVISVVSVPAFCQVEQTLQHLLSQRGFVSVTLMYRVGQIKLGH